MEYEVIVGLEVHAELSTQSKIYCSCKNSFGSEVNTQVCEICAGMPGTLPTLNEKVVEYAVRAGHALQCDINTLSKQDRKNYFYPDLPKAYQISQFDIPLCEDGKVEILVDGEERTIGVTRIHIEEDAGKLIHDESFTGTLADFNRCGVPLIEIVSEPDIRSAHEARIYLETLRQILMYIDVTDGKMQEGSLRCDVNVSVRPKGSTELNTRVEMKNVNTFSGAERAIEYEMARQIKVYKEGGTIAQETRRWDDVKGENIPLRSKENANDYHYFPEPDLGVIVVEDAMSEAIKNSLPELPNVKLRRYVKEMDLPQVDAEILVDSQEKALFFEEAVQLKKCSTKNICNWIIGDTTRILKEQKKEIDDVPLTPERLADMIEKIEKNEISNTSGKVVLEEMILHDVTPEQVIKEKGLAQISDTSALEELVADVLSQNPGPVEQYKNGKTNVLGFLVGQCMKLSKGQGNPAMLKEMMEKQLDES